MSVATMPYRVMYRLGFTPWDTGQIGAPLRTVVEGAEALPPGRALDLGCGTGTHSVYLAEHGWDVTGVDVVPRALQIAKDKAAAAGVHPTFVSGNITQLTAITAIREYSLVLDVACFHGLPPRDRARTADQITQVTTPGAIFLLFAFQPGRRGPLPGGMDRDEVVRLFGSGWEFLWEREATDAPALRGPLKNARPTGYCLRRHIW